MYEGMEQKIAVALLYDRIKAPTLTAKGSGDFAEEIVRKAEQANVPITEDKLLAATLAQLELNEEIPEESPPPTATPTECLGCESRT